MGRGSYATCTHTHLGVFCHRRPWIFPLVGGIFLSAAAATHPMPGLLTVGTFWLGVALVLVGTVPLTIRSLLQRLRTEDDELRSRRALAATQLAASYIPSVPVSDVLSQEERFERYNAVLEDLVRALGEEVFGPLKPRVIYFEYGLDAQGTEMLTPRAHFGCQLDPPKTHKGGQTRFTEMMVLVKSPKETVAINNLSDRLYRSFVSASVSGGDGNVAYGLLTVDTRTDAEFTSQDEESLLLVASLLAAFRGAAERH